MFELAAVGIVFYLLLKMYLFMKKEKKREDRLKKQDYTLNDFYTRKK